MPGLEVLQRFADLENEKEILAEKLKAVNKKLTDLQPLTQEAFIENNMDRITINGRTVFTRSILVAKILDKARATGALKNSGMGDLITVGFNTNSLSAHLRELNRDGKELPECFEGIITTIDVVKTQSRKA